MSGHPGKRRDRRASSPREEKPILPETTSDERDVGWGEDVRDERDEAWYRRERPPHHE